MKRWWIDLRPHSNARAQGYSTRHSAWSRPIVRFGVNAVCVMPVEDHDRIVAELRAEVAQAKREAADAMSGCCDCPMFKAQGKTVARQEKVIEKLKTYVQHRVDCICRAGVLQYSEECDCGLDAIEMGEA